MLQTPFTSFLEDDDGGSQRRLFPCLLPSLFCGHGFILKNKHKTDEDFVLLHKRTSSIFVEPVCRMYNSDFYGYIRVIMTSRNVC